MTHARATTLPREVYERYLPLVRRISMRLVRKMPQEIALDDLLGAGWVGLVEALGRRTAEMSEDEFAAYASHRIKGAMLDYLRSLDPLSRKMRGASKTIARTIRDLSARHGRAPEEPEIAREMGLELEAYRTLLGQVAHADFARLDVTEVQAPSESEGPDLLASRKELLALIARSIEHLPPRLQLVLGLHYQEEASLREIGLVLGVTESRVCQLHAEAIHRIRAHMMPERDDEPRSRIRAAHGTTTKENRHG